ncbi:hypothetical protein B566_EDAN014299 [Ephemera danica]|nr:hypothetical protein B566_EDAN014299 [Ephemera danica]
MVYLRRNNCGVKRTTIVSVTRRHLQQSVPKLEKQLEDQKEVVSRTSSDQKEVKRLQKEVERSTKELEEASAAAGKLEAQANQLRKQLEEIKQKHIGTLENKVKDLTKKINKAQADKTKLAAAIASCERNIQKSEEKIADNQQEMTDIEAEMINTKGELDELGEKAKELIAQKEATGEKVLELEVEYNELKDQNKGFQTEMQGIKSRRLDLESAVEKCNAEIKKNEALHAAEQNKKICISL